MYDDSLPRSVTEPISVLHVDDDSGFVEMAAEFLHRVDENIDVTTVTEPEQALDRFRADPAAIDCIVSDYDMPETDGLAFLKKVREEYPDVPFILFTGKGSEEVASKAISAGVTDYLQKDTGTDTYEMLAHRIRNAVQSHRAKAEAGRTRRFLEKILERATDVIAVVSPSGELLFVSGSVEQVLGYTPSEMEAYGAFDLIHPDDRERIQTRFEERMAKPDRATGVPHRVRKKDGEYVQLNARAYNLIDDPDIRGVLVYSQERETKETS